MAHHMIQARASSLPATEPADPLARLLAAGRPLVMGILNVTPDSFSDGGQFVEPKVAIDHAARMAAEGADILDIGAESSRPYGGNKPVDADEEIARLKPVLREVVALGLPVSIDTMKASVAAWAIGQGATIANDVWGLQRDPDMAGVVARHGIPVIVMHNRTSVDAALDIVADMIAFFDRTLAIADKAGIARDKIVLDPGIGFGKSTPDQSLQALAHVDRLKAFGLPILVGASRKRFIDAIRPAPPDQRIGGSIAAHLIAVQRGAAIIRSHDVAETVQALAVMAAIGAK
ncbi:MAG: folP [Xanthobacteraceae bacterium]|jgi:dihydropteroate synthase|nr:folP [Xanthobacteraceae bacterium]